MRRRRSSLAAALLLLAGAAACRRELAAGPARRQAELSDRVFAAARSAAGQGPAEQADAGLALREVALPSLAPQLRLLAAGDSEPIAQGAAEALVRIRLLRAADRRAELAACVRAESSALVQAACLERLEPWLDAALAPLVVQALSSPDAPLRRAALRAAARRADALPREAALAALGSAEGPDAALAGAAREALESGRPRPAERPSLAQVVALLEAAQPERRHDGLRALLQLPVEDESRSEGVTAALVHLLEDERPGNRLLAQAAFLRRSLAEAPPPADPAAQ